MTRGSILEYAAAVRGRYLSSTKKEKTKILDEFTQVTRLHRKAAIRLLHRPVRQKSGERRGRRPQYSAAAVRALKMAWETEGRMCGKRLQPFLPELLRVLRRHGELAIIAEVEAEVCRMSASTIDRLSRPWRRLEGHRRFSTTKPGNPEPSSGPFLFAPLLIGRRTALAPTLSGRTWWPIAATTLAGSS